MYIYIPVFGAFCDNESMTRGTTLERVVLIGGFDKGAGLLFLVGVSLNTGEADNDLCVGAVFLIGVDLVCREIS